MSESKQLPALPTPRNVTALEPTVEFTIILPPLVQQAGPRASMCVANFFAEIHNPNTHRAYFRAASGFFAWMERQGMSLATIRPVHVAAWMQALKEEGLAVNSIKQQLAAVRMLCDYLVRSGALEANATASVRGPHYSVQHGKTPVLDAREAGQLLASIPENRISGLRDRALIALMLYTFARISAALSMKVRDVVHVRNQLSVRLHDHGGNHLRVPCHHALVEHLTAYMQADGFRGASTSPLFRTVDRKSKQLSDRPLTQPDAWEVVRRRARAAGISLEICNHTFRAAGITAFPETGGTSEQAANRKK